MKITELYDLLDALKVAGYGGNEVYITYEAACRGAIHEVTIDIERATLFMVSNMIIRVYKAIDPDGTEVKFLSLDIYHPGEKVEGLDGNVYTILADKEDVNVLHR